jgi:hypothetical protein
MNRKIAIIGGGISGVTSAIKLAKNKQNEIHLYEKRDYLLKGPPYCHLHAGGILYPEISIKDAQELLDNSLEFANYFRDCLEYRPTIVAYRSNSSYSPSELLFKCKANKINYQFRNIRVIGNVENFYAVYTKEDMIHCKIYGILPHSDDIGRKYHDSYVIHFCKLLDDINSIKYPFVSVCEPGINQTKVEEKLLNELNQYHNIKVFTNKLVTLNELNNYNTIVNASGHNIFDNQSNEKYEFKSSWIVSSSLITDNLPEIAIIGERETENGMIQLTPINKGVFQIHCMRKDSTIIDTYTYSKQIVLNKDEIEKRGNVAIREVSKLFSILIMSKVKDACYGLQRIPYESKSKRTSNIVYFYKDNKVFIDIRTLKACSVISTVNKMRVV